MLHFNTIFICPCQSGLYDDSDGNLNTAADVYRCRSKKKCILYAFISTEVKCQLIDKLT